MKKRFRDVMTESNRKQPDEDEVKEKERKRSTSLLCFLTPAV